MCIAKRKREGGDTAMLVWTAYVLTYILSRPDYTATVVLLLKREFRLKKKARAF